MVLLYCRHAGGIVCIGVSCCADGSFVKSLTTASKCPVLPWFINFKHAFFEDSLPMKKIMKTVSVLLLLAELTACALLNPYHMREEGNVLQIASIRHVKSGRMMNDGTTVGATNVAQVTTAVGGSTG